MTKAEVKAIQPDRIIPISESCSGLLDFSYDRGKLVQVTMSSYFEKAERQCALIATKSLMAKYGEPDRTNAQVTQNDCGYGSKIADLCNLLGGNSVHEYHTYGWDRSGVTIVLTIERGSPDWSATYKVDPPATVGSVSKF